MTLEGTASIVTASGIRGVDFRDEVESANALVPQLRAQGVDVQPDPALTELIAKYRTLVAPIANRQVGTITADILRQPDASGESPLGNVIADAQLADTAPEGRGGAQLALMNPGGIRADLVFAPDGVVTYEEAFTVQPFNNYVVTMTLTGAQIDALLEQQFDNPSPGANRVLQVSAGFTYTWNAQAPTGSKIDPASIQLNGQPIDPQGTYRVTVNSFLADGGDNFTVLRSGTNRVVGGLDIDAFTAHLGANSPLSPPPTDRINVTP
jgi:5'-nucleotidase